MSLPGEFNGADLRYHEDQLRREYQKGDLGVVVWVRRHMHHRTTDQRPSI